LTGTTIAVLTLILVLPFLFLIEVLGIGHSGLQVLGMKIKMGRSWMKQRKIFQWQLYFNHLVVGEPGFYCAADAHYPIPYGRRDRLLQPSIYNRGLLLGETPNIDHLGKEGGNLYELLAG